MGALHAWAAERSDLRAPKQTPNTSPASRAATWLQVWSLMNLAYAAHEIISDYVSPALIWFESG